jgi:hypothetical protein
MSGTLEAMGYIAALRPFVKKIGIFKLNRTAIPDDRRDHGDHGVAFNSVRWTCVVPELCVIEAPLWYVC